MSGYSTKKDDDGSYSVVSDFGSVVSTGWSKDYAESLALNLNSKPNSGNDNTGSTNDTGAPKGSTSSQLSGKKTELGIFGKIFTFLGCAVVLIVGIFVALSILGWAIATFVVK